jgi:hypothetical protein
LSISELSVDKSLLDEMLVDELSQRAINGSMNKFQLLGLLNKV